MRANFPRILFSQPSEKEGAMSPLDIIKAQQSEVSRSGLAGNDGSEKFEKLFEMLLEAIPSSLLLINDETRIVAANKNFLIKNRKTRDETIGRKLEELLPEPLIENMDITGKVRQTFKFNQAIRGGRMTYRAPGVPLRIYYYSILPFVWHGQVEHVMLLMDDVTEQIRLSDEVLRAQRRYASVVESAEDIVLSTDSSGAILTWNTAAEKITNFRPHEVLGALFFDWVPKENRTELVQVFKNVRLGGKSEIGEWDIRTKGNQRVPIGWIFSGMQDETGATIGIVAIGRDLRERRELEMQLLKSQKLAALGVMAGGIAHEIRNPLAVSYSAAQFLIEEDLSKDFQIICVQKILAGIEKASTIIQDLLRFARPSSTTDMASLDLLSVIQDTIKLVVNQAKIQKVSIVLDSTVGKASVLGHANLLQQAFLNLFLNGINSMPEGGVLNVQLRKSDSEVAVIINDTGLGIARENLEKIFDPFYTLPPVGKGTGLGLSICHTIIVKQHLGKIEVTSALGEGSTFTVKLPVF